MADQQLSHFNQLSLKPQLLRALEVREYKSMTPVQAASLPSVLRGTDLTVRAKTGSGKTCCFSLEFLQKIRLEDKRPQALVLCPTRELAEQVAGELRKLAAFLPNIKVLSLYGGVSIGYQIRSLRHGARVLVGTPGRIADLHRKGHLDFSRVHTSVLDEADRMLEMGFLDEVSALLETLPSNRQNLLFSATFPAPILQLAQDFLIEPKNVVVEETQTQNIQERFTLVKKRIGIKPCSPCSTMGLLREVSFFATPRLSVRNCLNSCEKTARKPPFSTVVWNNETGTRPWCFLKTAPAIFSSQRMSQPGGSISKGCL